MIDSYNLVKQFPKSIDPDPQSSDSFGFLPFHRLENDDDHIAHFEISMHRPGISFKMELVSVFPELNGFKNCQLIVIPTFQYCHYDLVNRSKESDWERNLLLAYFVQFGREFVSACYKKGCLWADFTDPIDGLPVVSQRGSSIYPDVDGICRLLRYPTIQVGACAVIDHPRWRTRNYPGTLFAVGNIEEVYSAFLEISAISKNQ